MANPLSGLSISRRTAAHPGCLQRQVFPHFDDHLRLAAEIRVDIATAVECRVDMVRDMPAAPSPAGVVPAHDRQKSKPLVAGSKRFEFVAIEQFLDVPGA